jgi:hypothetical protein
MLTLKEGYYLDAKSGKVVCRQTGYTYAILGDFRVTVFSVGIDGPVDSAVDYGLMNHERLAHAMLTARRWFSPFVEVDDEQAKAIERAREERKSQPENRMREFHNPFRDWNSAATPSHETPYLLYEKTRQCPFGVISLSAKQMLGESFWMFSASMRYSGALIGVDNAVTVAQLEQMSFSDPVMLVEQELVRKLSHYIAGEIQKIV